MALPSLAFWRKEAVRFWDVLDEFVLAAYFLGVDTGIKLMPTRIAPLVQWDFINEAAIEYLWRYRLEYIANISETTRRQSVKAIENWLRSGEPLQKLKNKLRQTVLSPTRADAISITEVTRVTAAGNLEAWRSTGVVTGKKWQASQDEKMCVICGRLHGQIVEIDKGWTFSPEMLAENDELRKALGNIQAITFLQPPAHTNCRCYLLPFVSEVEVREQRRRRLELG